MLTRRICKPEIWRSLHPRPRLPHKLYTRDVGRRYGWFARSMSTGDALDNSIVFIDVSIDGGTPQRMVFELFDDIVPNTAANFCKLCTGEEGTCSETGVKLHYKGNKFHRIIPEFMVQAGDITVGDGTGGTSIYGETFRDENFQLKHSEAGLLSMASRGRNSNSSQFFITTTDCTWLDRKHVVFGTIRQGVSTLKAIEDVGSPDGTPMGEVEIVDCGIVSAGLSGESLFISKSE